MCLTLHGRKPCLATISNHQLLFVESKNEAGTEWFDPVYIVHLESDKVVALFVLENTPCIIYFNPIQKVVWMAQSDGNVWKSNIRLFSCAEEPQVTQNQNGVTFISKHVSGIQYNFMPTCAAILEWTVV